MAPHRILALKRSPVPTLHLSRNMAGGSMSTVSKGAAERDYAALSEVSSVRGGGAMAEDGEEEEELELGLSLGPKKATGCGGGREGRPKVGQWGERCRILTAEEFPSPLSCSSSVSSSSASLGGGGAARAKRVADSATPESATQPSQVVVGWPPIRAYRINNLVSQSKENTSDSAEKKNIHLSNNSNCLSGSSLIKDQEKRGGISGSSHFVKVNMDGDPIGRKVDLNAHISYDTLALALEDMFLKPATALGGKTIYGTKASRLLDETSEFALTYEDKDGDWMLVGDVPWRMFLNTIKRLRIMRSSDANGLTPRCQSSSKHGGLRIKPA